MQVTDAMVAKAAESDAAFDGRTWLAMPKSERERYMERSRRSLTAALAEMWRPIEEAPKEGRQMILLLTPSRFPQVAFSNTWWTAGFSVENKPTHWMPIEPLPAPPMGK